MWLVPWSEGSRVPNNTSIGQGEMPQILRFVYAGTTVADSGSHRPLDLLHWQTGLHCEAKVMMF